MVRMINGKIKMGLLTRKQRKVEWKTTAKKLMAQGTDESEEDNVLA